MKQKHILASLLVVLAGCSGLEPNPSESNSSGLSSSGAGSASAPTTFGTNPDQARPADIVSAAPAPASSANSTSLTTITPVTTGSTVAMTGPSAGVVAAAPPEEPMSESNAFRLLQQATFGPTEASLQEAKTMGPKRWLAMQFGMPLSTYGYRDQDMIHKRTAQIGTYCDLFPSGTVEHRHCWRDFYSADPLKLEFFKQATLGTDQLRQRMALALSQILVVSALEIEGTYGLADYNQMLRDRAFGNYRELLAGVTLHPVMGQYLNMVNNPATDPNENYARELLQLFSIGTCELNQDGTLSGGVCRPTYNNEMVREYAYALSGWTYPVGGLNPWCQPMTKCGWQNPTFLRGAMVAVPEQHDRNARNLLSGVRLPASRTPQQALDAVLDSVMNHPNTAPFIGKQLIQFFVTSNPSPAYVQRVATAFRTGKFGEFGDGRNGDLKATIAAILLDAEARSDTAPAGAFPGKMREPVVMMVSAVRALNGYTDGDRLGLYGYGSSLSQPIFHSPSVFNFYSPDYPLMGMQGKVAPQMQLVNANTSLNWINFANEMIYWWYNKGEWLAAEATKAGATGSRLNLASFEADAGDAGKLIDRMSKLFTGQVLTGPARSAVLRAVEAWTPQDTWLTDANNQTTWQRERVRTAAYLLIASPHFQVQR